MSSSATETSTLVNPLATVTQLETSSSRLHGVPADLENSIRFTSCRFIQASGMLLRLPQDIVAQAIVTFCRCWLGSDGLSLLHQNAEDVAIAAIYAVTKLSAEPQTPRNILNVCGYLLSHPRSYLFTNSPVLDERSFDSLTTEGAYQSRRARMLKAEGLILRRLGFQTHIALPFTLCINYLQTLEVFQHARGKGLARRAFEHLNTALLSPQLVYLTHQPNALATAAIYLSAKEVDVKLPEDEWWAVFDVSREELGFLVVGLTSMSAFAQDEQELWAQRTVPLTVAGIRKELKNRGPINGGK